MNLEVFQLELYILVTIGHNLDSLSQIVLRKYFLRKLTLALSNLVDLLTFLWFLAVLILKLIRKLWQLTVL